MSVLYPENGWDNEIDEEEDEEETWDDDDDEEDDIDWQGGAY